MTINACNPYYTPPFESFLSKPQPLYTMVSQRLLKVSTQHTHQSIYLDVSNT